MSKKNIYILIIVICFVGMAGVLYYGFGNSGGGSSAAPTLPTGISDTSGNPTSLTPTNPVSVGTNSGIVSSVDGSAPSVFPADTKFDWSLLDSDTFKNLQGIPPLTLDPSQIGRDNPFSPTK